MDVIQIMYKMMGALHKRNLSVVFKGSMVLRHVIAENTNLDTHRLTADFDIDWAMSLLSKEEFERLFQDVLDSLNVGSFVVVCSVEPKKNFNGTFDIYTPDGAEILFSIDLVKRQNEWGVEYSIPGGIEFVGASAVKMFADKIAVISGKAVLERPQDVYDLYLISHLKGWKLRVLRETLEKIGRKIYDFTEFLDEGSMDNGPIRTKYDSLTNIINPPHFDILYGRVRDFCMPFIIKEFSDDVEWYVSEQKWNQIHHSSR